METGPASAAFVAAGLGCAGLGVLTTLAETSAAAKEFLNWWNPAGPLTGKTGLAVAIWLVAWIVLHAAWRRRQGSVTASLAAALALIAVGVLGTFPIFFQSFGH